MTEIENTESDNGNHCSICGSFKVSIRGRYPGDPKRRICPCCTYERLEQINEISSPNYGVACKESKEFTA